MNILDKIKKKWMKLRYQPIRVFCFHQTSAVFDPSTMWECDWTEIGQFKRNILKLKSEYTFISLPEAYEKLKNDAFRLKKYAVLTSDDGWASLKEILPWLNEHRIPVTLFLNPGYMDGKQYREKDTEQYLNIDEIRLIVEDSKGLITIGMHGWTHEIPYELSEEDFVRSVEMTISYLQDEVGFIPFFAFPWGYCNKMNHDVLAQRNIVDVFCDGKPNYKFEIGISRYLLDGKVLD